MAIFIAAGALQLAGPKSIRDSFVRWGYSDWRLGDDNIIARCGWNFGRRLGVEVVPGGT